MVSRQECGEGPGPSLRQQLELGEIIAYPHCPFPCLAADDLQFLRQQRLAAPIHKNVAYNPVADRLTGHLWRSSEQDERLRSVLRAFSTAATGWLAQLLPEYARTWRLDRATLRTEEEALRRLRPTARNDLLHIDAFPTRPSHGWRILRLFVNINATDARIWVTSETFARLLERYGHVVGLPGDEGWGRLIRYFQPGGMRRLPYDDFMLRFHDFLKGCDDFQERGLKRLWTFPPGSAWLAFTDGIAHGELRGRHALEHSYFINPADLALPDQSPATLLEAACQRRSRGQAA